MQVSKFRKYLGHALHWLFFLVMISSIFWLPWYYIFLIFAVLRLQDYFLGGCILTWLEFGDVKRQWVASTFINKIVSTKKVSLKLIAVFIDYLVPLLIVVLAYFIQK
jgi:hypothetical protein